MPNQTAGRPIRVGDRLREFREMRGLSQRALAAKLNVAQPTLWQYEQGRIKFDADLLPVAAKVLGVKPCDFFKEEADRGTEDFLTAERATLARDLYRALADLPDDELARLARRAIQGGGG